jgi:hypothetical protein
MRCGSIGKSELLYGGYKGLVFWYVGDERGWQPMGFGGRVSLRQGYGTTSSAALQLFDGVAGSF